jgi:hypothetical protein
MYEGKSVERRSLVGHFGYGEQAFVAVLLGAKTQCADVDSSSVSEAMRTFLGACLLEPAAKGGTCGFEDIYDKIMAAPYNPAEQNLVHR